jgi:hypothetical protein
MCPGATLPRFEQFENEVTRTNNLQNRIEPRDFVAKDSEQRRTRQEMAIEGIDYQFVRSEEATPTATTCELIEVTTALACASGDSALAVQVQTGIGRFFNDLSKAPYKAIYKSVRQWRVRIQRYCNASRTRATTGGSAGAARRFTPSGGFRPRRVASRCNPASPRAT